MTWAAPLCARGEINPYADTIAPHSAPTNPLTYDARVVGLSGAGVATADGAAASLHNPALLQTTNTLSGTLTFTPYLVQLSVPFQFNKGLVVQKKTGLLFGPFTQFGLAARLHKRVVIGMNGFITGAAGGTFYNAPLNAFTSEAQVGVRGNVRAGQFAGEAQVPVTVRLFSWLDVGVVYRVTQAYTLAHTTTAPSGAPLGGASLRGTHLTGFGLGALSRISDEWSVGVNYRSEVQLDLNGERGVYENDQFKATSFTIPKGYRSPHALRVGTSFRPRSLPQVMATIEGHAEFYHRMDTRERDTFGGHIAGELTPLDWLSLRAGFSAATQPLTDRYASPTAAPPSMGYSMTSGAGLRLAHWRFDIALGYVASGKQVRRTKIPGRYAAEGFVGSASATYML